MLIECTKNCILCNKAYKQIVVFLSWIMNMISSKRFKSCQKNGKMFDQNKGLIKNTSLKGWLEHVMYCFMG